MTGDVAFLTIGGIVLLVLIKAMDGINGDMNGPGNVNQTDTGGAPQQDNWATPYYLRYNTAVRDDTGTVVPQSSAYTYALGVPAINVLPSGWSAALTTTSDPYGVL
jgi:hypothetical protein